jgi:hypothetical protein
VVQSYNANYDCYDPSIGHDLMTFGLMIYKSKVFFLSKLEDETKGIKLLQKQPYFRLRIGSYTLSTYSAGRSSNMDIEVSFPFNKTRASVITERNQQQLKLFPDDEIDDSNCREVILADIGNPEDGISKVFLGVPIAKDEDGRITRWGTTMLLWENEGFSAMTGVTEGRFYISPEEVKPPTVTLKGSTEQEKVEEIEPPSPTLKDDEEQDSGKTAQGDV